MFTTPADRSGRKGPGVTLIEEIELIADAPDVSFKAIPDLYRHLQVIGQCRTTQSASNTLVFMYFNGDRGSNYDYQVLVGLNTTAAAANAFAQAAIRLNEVPGATSSSANQAGSIDVLIPNYRGKFNKVTSSKGGEVFGTSGSTTIAGISFGQWRSTAPITHVGLVPNANSFLAGSVFSCYGYR